MGNCRGIKITGYSHDIVENKERKNAGWVTPTMLMKTSNLIFRGHDVYENRRG
jgi:hypothetical protein